MGESQSTLFRPEFNRSVHIESRPERLSSDGGALVLRALLHRLGLVQWLSEELADPRDPARTVYPAAELVRTALLLQGQGWSDQEDVNLLRDDPIFRLAVSSRRGDGPLRPATGAREPEGLCSQPTLSRFLRWTSSVENRARLDAALREGADRRHGLRWRGPIREATLDLDSVPVEVHGHQPGTAHNGHFGLRCYHPLVLHWDLGDFLGATLRPGNAHTADGGLAFALPTLRWMRQRVRNPWLRIDAGFPSGKFLRAVEGEGVRYVARLRTNEVLERLAAPHLNRLQERAPEDAGPWTYELRYGANDWKRERRVVLVAQERPEEEAAQEELFVHYFFLVTNASREAVPANELLARYRKRGRAEGEFGDWKSALQLQLSSSPRPNTTYRGRPLPGEPAPRRDSFAVNEAWLLLSLLAANLMDLARALYERQTRRRLSRERFRKRLLKVGARITLGSRQVKVIVAERMARAWTALWEGVASLPPIRGSPAPQARPLPA